MTINQFENTQFTSGLNVEYAGKIYPIISVCFEEYLIGINKNIDSDESDISWVRCENCNIEIIKKNQKISK